MYSQNTGMQKGNLYDTAKKRTVAFTIRNKGSIGLVVDNFKDNKNLEKYIVEYN